MSTAGADTCSQGDEINNMIPNECEGKGRQVNVQNDTMEEYAKSQIYS